MSMVNNGELSTQITHIHHTFLAVKVKRCGVPGLRMSFIIDDANNIHHQLKSGEADFVVLSLEYIFDEVESKILRSESYVLLCSPLWKNRPLEDVIQQEQVIDFEEDDQVTFNYLKNYHPFNAAKKERHFVNNTESLAYLITAGTGYGVLTKKFAKHYIQRGEIIVLRELIDAIN